MKKLSALFTCLLLVACADAPIIPPERVEAPRFTQLAPIGFKATELRIASEFEPSFRAPNVEHLFQVSPAEAVAIWAQDRLRVNGEGGLLEVIIQDASVTETSLETKKGIGGWFTKEPSEQYDARILVLMKLYDGVQRLPAAEAEVKVELSRSIQEGADVYARELLFNTMLVELTQALNAQMEKEIQAYFSPYLITVGH